MDSGSTVRPLALDPFDEELHQLRELLTGRPLHVRAIVTMTWRLRSKATNLFGSGRGRSQISTLIPA